MIAIFDIETDGLYNEVTQIHCIAVKCDDEKTQLFTSKDGNIGEAVKLLNMADLVVAHNGVNFDLPVLEKLGLPVVTQIHDTIIMSRLTYPNMMVQDANRKSIPPRLKGSHSLKAWGYRLRKLKGDFAEDTDWKEYSDAMGQYCIQDVEVTYALYNKLIMRGIPEEAIWLEQEFARIISRQEKYGVYFDMEKAKALHIQLLEEVERAENELVQTFTPLDTWVSKPYPKVPFKKDGTKSQVLITQETLGCHYNDKGEWGYYKEVAFNPSSRQHIARWLSEVYGWKPTDFTEKGSVIINETVLESLTFPEGKILAHYFNVKKLLGQLAEGDNAWLKMVAKDGRIHGRVNTLGAVSRRCTHSSPNMAQVPSGRAYKGHEARTLFTVPKGKKLVGCDADALELRTLSHFMASFDGGSYGRIVDQGKKEDKSDVHSVNQRAFGVPTRDDAKTTIYAMMYGAGDVKLASVLGSESAEDGRKLRENFLRGTPAFKRLLDAVASKYKQNGHLKALDGNPYHIRSSHSALNTLLQGAGALVMKYYLIFLDQNLQKKYTAGTNYEFVLNVHDEVQIECDEAIAEDVAKIAEASFDDVTKYLNFRIPLRGSADIGDSWADTH
jgi:DNA polymerase I-like protein with 3'-5' exonuclease and polymerase domains